MIKKISETSYIKRLERMTMQERRDYMNRVGAWLREQRPLLARRSAEPMAMVQSIVQLGAAWNEREQQAFATGAQLLTALMGLTDTWLPDNLYKVSAKRSINHMAECLFRLTVGTLPVRAVSSSRLQVSSTGAAKEDSAVKTRKGTQTVAGPTNTHTADGSGAAAPYNHEPKRAAGAVAGNTHGTPLPSEQGANEVMKSVTTGLKPVRPKHIDQYVHLLPKATQERAAKWGPLKQEMEAARESLLRLTEDPQANPKVCEMWAKKIKGIDDQLGSIGKELNREWDKVVATGRVVVDDLGMAHILPGDGEPVEPEPAELTSEQKQRRRALRKFLTDTRRGNGSTRDEHVGKWQNWWKEYITLEPIADALADEKITEAANHYGIDLASIETKDKE